MANSSLRSKWLVMIFLLEAIMLTNVAFAGDYYDLGRPVIGAWQRKAWVARDPVLGRDLLWSQESSQDGAIFYALDIETGIVIEEHPIPAREVGGVLAAADGVLYLYTYSGLNHPGNELLRFDPRQRKIERLGLAKTPRNRCVGGAIGPDGNVYIGTHQQGRLFRFDTHRRKWADLGRMVPPPIRSRQNVWLDNLHFTRSGKLLAAVVRTPPAEVVEIDLQDNTFRKLEEIRSRRFRLYGEQVLAPTKNGFTVFNEKYQKVAEITLARLSADREYSPDALLTLLQADLKQGVLAAAEGNLVRIDLTNRKLTTIAEMPFDGEFCLTSDAKRAIVIHHPRGKFAVVDLNTGVVQTRQIGYQPKRGTQICGLNRASDGSIYGTNIIGMHLFRCDPQTDKLHDLGHVGWSGGEVYNVIDVGGRIYFGTYGGAHWGVYDPAKPWRPDFDTAGKASGANPRWLGQLGGADPDAANRPFEYVEGPRGKIYIACRANYGHPGGALVEFDPGANQMRVFRDLKRSVQTVSADERYIFAGTNIHGGRGSGDRADVATLFVHDPKTGRRVFEKAVVSGAKAIVCLRYNPQDRRVYATTDNQLLLRLHPRSFEVDRTWKLRCAGTPLAGVPEDVGMLHITVAQSGDVYGVGYRELYRLRNGTDEIEYLETPPLRGLYQIVEGKPGVFYLGAGTHLLKYVADPPMYYR